MITAEQIIEQNVPQLRVPEPYVMDPAAKSAYVPDRSDPAGSGSGSGSGSDFVEEGGFENSALGGMLSMMGGFGGEPGADIEDAQTASFISGQYTMVQQVLKVSIRKVTLVVWWDVMGRTRELKTVAFFTDASAMDKVLMGLGSQELPEAGAGSGSGTTPGTGSSGTGGTRPTTPGGGSGRKP
jgi:hypothetical protein